MATLAHDAPARALENLKRANNACRKCSGKGTSYVFGTGNPRAPVVFVGEAPGLEEDRRGQPFVGRAGKLLNRLIESIGLKREDVYITNVVKCHPMKDPSHPEKRGNDRPPTKKEIEACLPVVEKEIDIINPKVVCTMGNTATQALLKTKEGTVKLRGNIREYRGAKLLPTYHPAAVLRNPALRDVIAGDFLKIKEHVQRRAPSSSLHRCR